MTEEVQKNILILDDEPNMRHMLTVLVEKEGYQVTAGADGKEGIDLLQHHTFDFILCDIKMPNMSGMEFLESSGKLRGDATVIMMSAFGAIDTAIEAMKLGAYDFISKPFKTDEVLLTLKKAEERENLKRENRSLKLQISQVKDDYRFGTMLAHSKAMRDVFRLSAKVAQFDTTVLVTGESGTGKELVARGIHYASARSKMPLVIENCGCVPENLLESLFFGHVKGAFTGADHDKKGLFEEADKGTIFLDEIGDLPLQLQVKLLRVLQEGEIRPVGAAQSIAVDVRVVAATALDLAHEVEEGRFRQDLYYRLNVLPITLPPLRRRPADIPLLCDHFIAKFKDRMGLVATKIDKEAMKMLLKYPWPGNVRELENTIERAAILCTGEVIQRGDVHPDMGGAREAAKWSPDGDFEKFLPSDMPLPEVLTGVEEKMVKRALEEANFVQARAAEGLGITKSLLQYKMKKYHLLKK